MLSREPWDDWATIAQCLMRGLKPQRGHQLLSTAAATQCAPGDSAEHRHHFLASRSQTLAEVDLTALALIAAPRRESVHDQHTGSGLSCPYDQLPMRPLSIANPSLELVSRGLTEALLPVFHR